MDLLVIFEPGCYASRRGDVAGGLMHNWRTRFLSTTPGQIIVLLRRAHRTRAALAESLALTDNGVRGHLATLERDGLIRQAGTRRGSGKPAYTYELTPDADALFPKAYDQILDQLLDVLGEQLPPETVDRLLHEVGHRLATGRAAPSGDLASRVEWGAGLLRDMGGLPEVEADGSTYRIRGYSCPLASLVARHPQACRLAEVLLSEVIGAPVKEQCERGDRPRCCFEVLPGTAATA